MNEEVEEETKMFAHSFKDGFALLIGVGYCAEPVLTLPGTVYDALALERILKDPRRCAYPTEQINLLINSSTQTSSTSKQNILQGLKWLETQTTPDSTVLIYFSGHATYVSTSEKATTFYLVPSDTNLEDIAGTALSSQAFNAALATIQYKKLLVIFDCCHAEGFISSKNGRQSPSVEPHMFYSMLAVGRARTIMLSSGQHQFSWMLRNGEEQSVFTYHLVEALQGKASLPGEKYITVDRIFEYVSEKVPKTVKAQYSSDIEQTPQINRNGEQFVVALLPQEEGQEQAKPADSALLYVILRDCPSFFRLKDLCFELNIDANELDGANLKERAQSLFEILQREERLSELEQSLRRRYPRRFT